MRKITAFCVIISVIFLTACGNRLRIVREPRQDIETAEKIQLTDIEKKLDEVKSLYLKDETEKAKKLIYEILSAIDKENTKEIEGQLNDLLKEIKKKKGVNMKKLTIVTLIIVVSVFMLNVGCKKDPVATDLINVSVSQSRVPSGGQAYIIGYVVNPQENVYNLSIRVSEGWVSYDSTFSDRFQAIYYALENLTDYDILVGGTVHAYINTFSATQTFQMFILPKETEETAESNKYYLVVDTGELYSKETGKVVKILDLEVKPADDGKNITVRVLE